MKKFLPIALVLIALVGIGFYVSGKQPAAQVSEKTGDTTAPQVVEKKNMVSSIKDAMGLGQKMACTYTSNAGKDTVTSTVFVDGQKFKATTEVNGTKTHVLSDGENQYMWTDGTKQGWKINKACMDELSKAVPAQTDANKTENPQDFEKSFGDAANVQCAPSSEDFSIPTDVNFADQCEMMRSSLKAMEGLKGKLPAGVNIPGY